MQQALDNVSKSRTTLIIAHRLSTIQKAHKIAVIADGTVAEQGNHRELLNKNGAYAALVRAQSLEKPEKAPDEIQTVEESSMQADQPLGDDHADNAKPFDRILAESPKCEDQIVHESMQYSLLKCLSLLVKEQPRWWPLYGALALSSLLAGERSRSLDPFNILMKDDRWNLARDSCALLSHIRNVSASGQRG